ncbi:MAG: hypothetical protein ABW217_18060 [Polyangiaceae bacterium]
MQWTRWCSIVVFSGGVSVALAACGGNSQDPPGSGALDTGIAEDKPLGDVTDAEAVQACNRLGAALEERLPGAFISRQTCTLFAIGETSVSACNSGRDDCIADSEEVDVYDPSDCEDTNADELQGCTATVGELETCTDEYTNELKDLLDRLSCDNVGTSRANDVTLGTLIAYRLPDSCTSVQERCPNAPIFNVADTLGGF